MEVDLYRIVSVEQMRALEKEADSGGLSFAQMMQNAGNGAGFQIDKKFKDLDRRSMLGLVGAGNNGGDALVALTYLQKRAWETRAYLIKDRDETDALVKEYLACGGILFAFDKDENFLQMEELIRESNFLLDGVLGTGLHLPLQGTAKIVLQHLKGMGELPFTIALDCPSGVDCDSGEADDAAIRANWTICMAAVKQGLLRFPAFEYVGDLSVVDINLPPDLRAWNGSNDFCMEVSAVAEKLPKRPWQAHKGTFGTALLFAGSRDYPGTAYLAGKAAYLAGAGLVKLATIPEVQHAVAGAFPEAVWCLLKTDEDGFTWDDAISLQETLRQASSILVGPGWGKGTNTAVFFKRLFDELKEIVQKKQSGIVFDADGLNLLSEKPDLLNELPAGSVLTPHPGEMARLTGLPMEHIQQNRKATASEYAKKWNAVVVLKGALTVAADPSDKVVVIPVATPALARAGSGDILAGMIVGLMAQGVASFDAACMAAWMHGEAGKLAERSIGHPACVLAGDILQAIPQVFRELKTGCFRKAPCHSSKIP
jgi:NAD(P)H-hydrate epimerase